MSHCCCYRHHAFLLSFLLKCHRLGSRLPSTRPRQLAHVSLLFPLTHRTPCYLPLPLKSPSFFSPSLPDDDALDSRQNRMQSGELITSPRATPTQPAPRSSHILQFPQLYELHTPSLPASRFSLEVFILL